MTQLEFSIVFYVIFHVVQSLFHEVRSRVPQVPLVTIETQTDLDHALQHNVQLS